MILVTRFVHQGSGWDILPVVISRGEYFMPLRSQPLSGQVEGRKIEIGVASHGASEIDFHSELAWLIARAIASTPVSISRPAVSMAATISEWSGAEWSVMALAIS